MKIEELEKLAKMIVLNRPQHYKYMRDNDISILAQSWLPIIGQYDYDAALICFFEWLKYDTKGNPINICDVVEPISTIKDLYCEIQLPTAANYNYEGEYKLEVSTKDLMECYKKGYIEQGIINHSKKNPWAGFTANFSIGFNDAGKSYLLKQYLPKEIAVACDLDAKTNNYQKFIYPDFLELLYKYDHAGQPYYYCSNYLIYSETDEDAEPTFDKQRIFDELEQWQNDVQCMCQKLKIPNLPTEIVVNVFQENAEAFIACEYNYYKYNDMDRIEITCRALKSFHAKCNEIIAQNAIEPLKKLSTLNSDVTFLPLKADDNDTKKKSFSYDLEPPSDGGEWQ